VFGRCSTGKRHGVGFRRGRGTGGWQTASLRLTPRVRDHGGGSADYRVERRMSGRGRPPAARGLITRSSPVRIAPGYSRNAMEADPLRGDAPATACPDSPIAVGISGSLA
jgi:hypothetical protein